MKFSSDLKYIILHYLRVRQCYGFGYSCMQSVDTNIFIFILHLLSKQEPLAMFGQKIVTAFQHKNVAKKQDRSALFISEHVVYNQSRITLTSLIHSWTLHGQSDNSSLCTMMTYVKAGVHIICYRQIHVPLLFNTTRCLTSNTYKDIHRFQTCTFTHYSVNTIKLISRRSDTGLTLDPICQLYH